MTRSTVRTQQRSRAIAVSRREGEPLTHGAYPFELISSPSEAISDGQLFLTDHTLYLVCDNGQQVALSEPRTQPCPEGQKRKHCVNNEVGYF